MPTVKKTHPGMPPDRDKKRVRVAAAIFQRDGRVLIARRKKGDRAAGYWEFPGGKVEPGETPEECLEREMAEEFGVLTRVGKPLGSIVFPLAGRTGVLEAFAVTLLSGSFELREHEAIRWVTPEECRSYRLAKPDRELLDQLFADLFEKTR